jgi:hypothetical protein
MEEQKYLSVSGGFDASSKANAGGQWLQKGTPEFDQVFFYLKSCLPNIPYQNNIGVESYGTSDLEIDTLEVWRIDNPDHAYRYERRTKNLLKLACWTMPNTDLNSVESICTNGFRIPPDASGLGFTTGLIDLPTYRNNSKTYTYIYSEIGVGRAFVCDNIEAEIPNGFDSLYITPQPLDRNRDGKFSLSEYRTAARFEYRQATYVTF